MVSAVVFEFSVMRCQPLRRALSVKRRNNGSKWSNIYTKR
ncbi:acetyltransferase [Vibrio mimicus]|nr:acetyltransferase [Vibrio mimicus]